MTCGITHHAGCVCHEARHADEIARLTRERDAATARHEALRAAVIAERESFIEWLNALLSSERGHDVDTTELMDRNIAADAALRALTEAP